MRHMYVYFLERQIKTAGDFHISRQMVLQHFARKIYFLSQSTNGYCTGKSNMCFMLHESKSLETVQRCLHLKYSNRPPQSKDSIECWYKQFKDTGNVEQWKGTQMPQTSTQNVNHRSVAFMRNPSTLTHHAKHETC